MHHMKNLSKNFLWVLVGLMVLSALYSIISGGLSEKKEISLSDMVAKINAGEVAEIAVAAGAQVAEGAKVMTIEPTDEAK